MQEKRPIVGRDLLCCGRAICSKCLNQNKRYETYCPYCQITTAPSPLPQGLRDPPPYSVAPQDHSVDHEHNRDDELPAYNNHAAANPPITDQKASAEAAPDVLHFLAPNDTMLSLSLAYGVPIVALRKANNVYADHLLQGRKTVIIPGEYYKGGVSLSPQPLEGEEEEIRRNKIRRWMVACKVAEYDVALLYLNQEEWHLEAAIDAYRDDERWEKEHPLEGSKRTKPGGSKSARTAGMRRFVGSSSSAQIGGRI